MIKKYWPMLRKVVNQMKKNENYILWGMKGLCILAIIGMIFPLFAFSKVSNRTFEEVLTGTIQNMDMTKYPEKDMLALKRYFNLDSTHFEQIVFYRSDDAMDAEELVLAQFNSQEARHAFQEAMEKRITSQTTTYEGYAPDQLELMKNARLVVYDNYGLYIVGAQADQIVNQFETSL